MISRLFYNAAQGIRTLSKTIPKGQQILVKGAGVAGRVGKVTGSAAFEGAKGMTSKASDVALHIAESSGKYAYNVGKFAGSIGGEVEMTARGINNILGAATSGVESKVLNDGLNNTIGKANGKINKVLKTNMKTDFSGHRFGALLKDSDDSLVFGKKATKLGTGLVVGAGAVMGTKDAVVDRIHQQRGTTVGSANNAPVNTYAYQGASYADNAGATGDLALSLHRQRHSGIL